MFVLLDALAWVAAGTTATPSPMAATQNKETALAVNRWRRLETLIDGWTLFIKPSLRINHFVERLTSTYSITTSEAMRYDRNEGRIRRNNSSCNKQFHLSEHFNSDDDFSSDYSTSAHVVSVNASKEFRRDSPHSWSSSTT